MKKSKRIEIDRGPVQEALILPVIARALESKRPRPLLIDPVAMEIVEKLDCDLTTLISSTSELTRVAWIVRSTCFERLIKDFIRRYPEATIVNIGCGLDTIYERINNRSILWYDFDLPEVIELRKLFMNETENRKFIAGSFLDNNWYKHIRSPEHILFVSGGVFYYYEEKDIRTLFVKLSQRFPSCELLFDVTSEAGVRVTNRILRKSGIGNKYFLKWGLKSTSAILSWTPRLRLLGKYYTYKQEGISMNLKNKLLGWMSDLLGIQYIVHFKIRPDYKHLK